jgi:hypothetical protein
MRHTFWFTLKIATHLEFKQIELFFTLLCRATRSSHVRPNQRSLSDGLARHTRFVDFWLRLAHMATRV